MCTVIGTDQLRLHISNTTAGLKYCNYLNTSLVLVITLKLSCCLTGIFGIASDSMSLFIDTACVINFYD